MHNVVRTSEVIAVQILKGEYRMIIIMIEFNITKHHISTIATLHLVMGAFILRWLQTSQV